MAQQDRFYIGYLDNSATLQTSVKPFAIPDNAFSRLNNAYVFRGRVRKRFGSKLMTSNTAPVDGYAQLESRLRIALPATNGSGNQSGTVPGMKGKVGQMFSIGNNIYTVYQDGALLTTSAGAGTFDLSNGNYTFTGALALTAIYFYPATPVMGLVTYQSSNINAEDIVAFDTQFSYKYTALGWDMLGTYVWTGSDSQFFWGTNWRGITSDTTYLFVTNYKSADGIQYADVASFTDWQTLNPILNNTNTLITGRIILPFKNRLICLNTIEGVYDSNQFSGSATSGTGDFNQTVAGTYSLGQRFKVGNTVLTIIDATPASLQPMLVASYPGTKTPATAQFNITTGNLVITGNGNNVNTNVYFISGTPDSTATYVNRCRYSLNGDVTSGNGWLEGIPGLGGYVDASTREAIITAQFLKDRLIVYFESSTWELAYTGNQVLPFIWQQINTELGAESTFSQVSFDKYVLGVGNVGIHACNGSNVDRIDDKIPDSVFEIHNDNNGIERVAGIRDYFAEMVYWSFPSENADANYPYSNRVLTYNYKTGSWGFNDDAITAFGYFQTNISGSSVSAKWGEWNIEWQESGLAWRSPTLQAKFNSIIAGNQEGFVFIISPDISVNAQSLQITNIDTTGAVVATITCINHSLQVGSYVNIESCQGLTYLNDLIFKVISRNPNDFDIDLRDIEGAGDYTGGGTIRRVTPVDIMTKQYNFYADQGRNASVGKVDFLVSRTDEGECTVDYFASSSISSIVDGGKTTGALVGTSALSTKPYDLIPLEATQARLWHPVYTFVDGEYVQMRIYLSEEQVLNPSIADSEFELHAMVINAQPTSSRLQ